MSKRLVLIVLLVMPVLSGVSPLSWSWNTYGHLLTADFALAKLPPAKQRAYDQLAFTLVRQMDAQKRLYLMRTFEDTSAFAHLSVLPDDWRGITVSSLYDQYGEGLPEQLRRYADTTTDNWHYINQPYHLKDSAKVCAIEEDNVVSVLPNLIEAYRETKSEANKALTLAFIVHLVSDVHNPLHTMTRVDDECESDLGGNRFCVAYHRGGSSCEQNLHQAWDSALGFFEEYEKVADAEYFLSYVKVDERAAAELDPQVWAEEGFEFSRLVYSATEGQTLDPFYIDEGKIISYEQIALAAARLAAILDEL